MRPTVWEGGPVSGESLYSEVQCISGNGHMETTLCVQIDRQTDTTENITLTQLRWGWERRAKSPGGPINPPMLLPTSVTSLRISSNVIYLVLRVTFRMSYTCHRHSERHVI